MVDCNVESESNLCSLVSFGYHACGFGEDVLWSQLRLLQHLCRAVVWLALVL